VPVLVVPLLLELLVLVLPPVPELLLVVCSSSLASEQAKVSAPRALARIHRVVRRSGCLR